jgi:hypothetical protein
VTFKTATKNDFFSKVLFAYYFLKQHLHHFSKIKLTMKSQYISNEGSYYSCLMIEGSGSGSVPLPKGSGSGRPKNIRILQIRIRNTTGEVGTTPDPFREVKLFHVSTRNFDTFSKLEFVGFSLIKGTGSRDIPHFEFKDALMSYPIAIFSRGNNGEINNRVYLKNVIFIFRLLVDHQETVVHCTKLIHQI